MSKNKSNILVTGVSGKLGRFLVKRLHREFNVIGLDRRKARNLPKDVQHYKVDIRRNRVEDIFRNNKIDAILHLGVMHDLRQNEQEHHNFNIVGTTRLLEYAEKYKVKKFIFLSSINVYGPKSTNSQFLSENEPLMAGANFSEIRDLVDLDMLVTSYFWKAPKLDIVILRAAHILGNINNAPSNYLRLSGPIPAILGFDPMLQVIHQADLADALIQSYKSKTAKGIFNIASNGELPLSEMIEYMGKKRLPLPEPMLKVALNQMWLAKISSFPAKELDHIKYICMGDTTRATEVLKFEPKYTITDAIDSLNTLIF